MDVREDHVLWFPSREPDPGAQHARLVFKVDRSSGLALGEERFRSGQRRVPGTDVVLEPG